MQMQNRGGHNKTMMKRLVLKVISLECKCECISITMHVASMKVIKILGTTYDSRQKKT